MSRSRTWGVMAVACTAIAAIAGACADTPDNATADAGADAGPPDASIDSFVSPDAPSVDAPVDAGNPFCNIAGDASGIFDTGAPYAAVTFPLENPFTQEKATLGKILFWEEQLSSDNTMACGTCHQPAAGGSDGRAKLAASRHPGPDGVPGNADDPHGSMGVARCDDSNGPVVRKSDPKFGLKPQVTRRKAPTYLDAMFNVELFWDGRAHTQFIDPQNPDAGDASIAIAAGGALESRARRARS